MNWCRNTKNKSLGGFMLKKLVYLASSAAMISSSAIHAQESDNGSSFLEEIVVTATKRAQSLQDTPVAVYVTTAATIEKAQILDLKDLQTVVPTLRVSQLQNSSNTSLSVRGFGNGGNNLGIEPAVGVFIDGVYRSRAAAQIGALPNIERVEVLSGPQSTLFGKNAQAGVVSIVTPKPSYDRSGYVEAGLGNYNQTYARASLTGGLSDSVAGSIGGGYQKRDGYFTNLAEADDFNDINRFNLRGQLLWEPNETTSIRVIADVSEIDENCCGTGVVRDGPFAAGGPDVRNVILALGGNQPSSANQFSYETYANTNTQNEISDGGISLQADFDLGNAAITSITAFRKNDSDFGSDSDFNSLRILGNTFQNVEIETFTQELRFTASIGDNVDVLVGGYYFDETLDQESGLVYGADTAGYLNLLAGGALPGFEQILGFAPGTFFGDGTTISEFFVQDDKGSSLFGTVDIRATDRLTATLGLNYTKDEKNVSGRVVNNDVFGNLSLNGDDGARIISALTGIPAAVVPFVIDLNDPAANPLGGLFGLQFQPQQVAFPNSVEDGRTDDDKTTWTVRLAYEVNDNFNFYASAATGFKASSWNLTRDGRPFIQDALALQAAGLLPNNYVPSTGRNFGTRFALPEEATVYELGLKARFEKGAINMAIFDQTIENFQSTIFQGTGFVLANAGEQSTLGVEFDAIYKPIDSLELSLAGVLLDPVYDSFTGASGPNGTVVDLSGEKPAGISDTSLSLAATYYFTVAGKEAFLRGDYQYESEVQIVDNIAGVNRETNSVNASFGIDLSSGLSLRLWGRNVFNDETYTSAFPGVVQGATINAYPNQPRTYGASLRYNF
jgi:outer membrane receptor protein involved in Fe transport